MDIYELKPFLSELINKMEQRVPYAAALATENSGERITVSTRQQRSEAVDPSIGVVFTVFNGRYFKEAATNDLSKENLKKTAIALAEESAVDCSETGITINPGDPANSDFFVDSKIDNASIKLSEKVAKCIEYKDSLHSMDRRVVSATGHYSWVRIKELFTNRTRQLFQDITRSQSIVQIVMAEDSRTARLHEGHCFQGGYEHIDLNNNILNEMINDCARILKSNRLTPGTYDCIFSPEFSGIFAHEAFGHGTETDMFLKHRARGQEFLGRQVASPLVNMYDSPLLPGQGASFFFDHEGQAASETQIIKDGILISGLTEMNSAMRLKINRTANGRRESFDHKVYARMTNTFFGPGKDNFEDMIKDIEFGYLLTRPSNGMEDPKGWGIQLEGYIAIEIKSGKLTDKYYSPVIVTGYVPDLLMSITMVGNDLKISGLGMCGKGHKEWVKVTDGGPYLRLKARLG
ncbi:TldD/PmbA family protein [Candidatus Desantisbacteria bacterium]|nr:TldD/PmbA family protein [Candidatus Desantisbacteria bacterium]